MAGRYLPEYIALHVLLPCNHRYHIPERQSGDGYCAGLRVYLELSFGHAVFQRNLLFELAGSDVEAQESLGLPGQEPDGAVLLVYPRRAVGVEVFARAASDGSYVTEEFAGRAVVELGRAAHGCADADVVVAECVGVAGGECLDPAVQGYELRLSCQFGDIHCRGLADPVEIDADEFSVIFLSACGCDDGGRSCGKYFQ